MAKQKKQPKKFEISAEVKELAEKVINEQKVDIYPSKLEYLLVYPCISKTVAGKCVKSGKELKFFSTFDYLIEISGELWDALDEKTREILIEHELKHVLPVANDKTGDWEFKIRDHNVQDFASIIKKHGIDWISKVKASQASLYEIDEEDVKI
jgi:NTP pyrophosphatase (non-canonical NTP hydrolase)